MKTWRSEFVHNYRTSYSIGYCLYAQPEAGDNLHQPYAEGYIPYSNAANVQNVFYMCRSLRLNLKTFQPNSENRRVHRLFEGKLTASTHPATRLLEDKELQSMYLAYYAHNHGADVMPKARLIHALQHMATRNLTLYHDASGALAACVRHGGNDTFNHYWSATWAAPYYKSNLGMWLMVDGVLRAQQAGQSYIYLGSAYGAKATYKTNFSGVEWWAGNSWRSDPKNRLLKDLMAHDAEKSVEHASRWQKKAVGFEESLSNPTQPPSQNRHPSEGWDPERPPSA